MKVNFKSKSGCGLFSRKTLPFISLLFLVALFSSHFIYETNGLWLRVATSVGNEVELRDAISAAPDNEAYVISLWSVEFVLEKPLEIPAGKHIGLVSGGASLIGANGVDTIIVKSGGELTLWDGIVVTHIESDTGRGVFVERGGRFDLA